MLVLSGESISQEMNSTENINSNLLIDDFSTHSVILRAFPIPFLAKNETAHANQITVGAPAASLDMV
jgi:hypothetical protein